MTHEYFGVVTKVMESGSGEVRGLARLVKGAPDPHFDAKRFFEPDGDVFVDRLPSQLKVGAPVLFDAEENPQPRGRDRLWVKHDDGGRPTLELHGFAVLDAAASVVDLDVARPTLRQNKIPAGSTRVYLRYENEHGSCLRGPWTVRDGCLHAIESDLHEWPDRTWSAEDHFSAPDGAWEVLLSPLKPNSGRPLDHMSGDDLASWFLKKAEAIPPLAEIVGQLHREGRKLLKSEFKELGDETERRLFKARFPRVLSILKTLELGDSELERIAKAPAFERLWQDALNSKIAELEEKAKADLRNLRDEQQAIKRGIGQLQHQKSELEAKVDKLRVRERKSKADLFAAEKKKVELATYIGENQHRLLNDVRALAPLLSGRDPVVRGAIQPSATIPALEKGEPGTQATDGLRGLTIRACRLTLLLDPFSARETAAKRGWRMFLLQVEPHWLCFDDAWRAGLRSIFEAVVGDGVTTLLHLQDLDRSPPELWLRPVLDLASGLRDALIEGRPEWPEALRITASMAPGPPRHALGYWLLRHFATPEPAGEQPGEGPVSDNTRQPRGSAAGAEPESFGAAGLKPFVEREVKTLAELLAKRSASDEEDRAYFEARAQEIRREWPLTFGRWP